MNDLRTAFEKELSMFVYELSHFFDKRVVEPGEYMTMRGKIRDLKVYLDNKQMGCPNGKHESDCSKLKH